MAVSKWNKKVFAVDSKQYGPMSYNGTRNGKVLVTQNNTYLSLVADDDLHAGYITSQSETV